MLEVKEADLPAIGKKFTIETAAEETIVVIIRLTGEREVYRLLKACPCQDVSDSPGLFLGEVGYRLWFFLAFEKAAYLPFSGKAYNYHYGFLCRRFYCEFLTYCW